MLRQAIASRDGSVHAGANWRAAESLHDKGLGTYYPAELVFVINERGRWALSVEPEFVPSKVPTCSVPGCDAPGTSPVGCGGHAPPMCRDHARIELRRRLGKPLAPEFTERELLDALNSSTSMLMASKKLGVCISTLESRAKSCTDATSEALERCRARGHARRGSALKPREIDERELIDVLNSSTSMLMASKRLHAHPYTIRACARSPEAREALERCTARGRLQGGAGLRRRHNKR
jgi:hypothetical protein